MFAFTKPGYGLTALILWNLHTVFFFVQFCFQNVCTSSLPLTSVYLGAQSLTSKFLTTMNKLCCASCIFLCIFIRIFICICWTNTPNLFFLKKNLHFNVFTFFFKKMHFLWIDYIILYNLIYSRVHIRPIMIKQVNL